MSSSVVTQNVKTFIVSLPRTGTTSACVHLLGVGLRVAHTAYSSYTIPQADVTADTPIFCDYAQLQASYPDARFVYLQRPIEGWLLSIRRLLSSMRKQWARDKSVFEPDIQRCFQIVFPHFDTLSEYSDRYLLECYTAHKNRLNQYFVVHIRQPSRLITLDITTAGAGDALAGFCTQQIHTQAEVNHWSASKGGALPRVNMGRRITYWECIQHPNKIASK